MLIRGERLDDAINKSDDLSSESVNFYKKANKKSSSGMFGGLFGSS